ncbi:MAG: hypothetical protein CBD56_01250 [Candidatus Pelagibacter sp. TMED196]|nr:MAG: hypothetical protein CBD56_01250 [Candidatus Pelagibacter sp. TMED196]|tara:strand:- start:1513 stop:2175 length:663 start_codon:yes stop_codon:yes gene_type:complete
MSQQLIFNFPFKRTYLSQDFYISKNNFNAFKLIESWPQWPSRFINIFGPKGCGKTHLANIISSKIRSIIISPKKVDENIINKFKTKECLIIDDFDNDIEENLLYSIINLAVQDNKYLIISSPISLKKFKINLKDLNSRFTSFIEVGIDLPTDDLIKVILTKNFSDKQITISKKNIDYILNNIDRSYEKINLFSNLIDNLSLEKAKPINLKLIKDVLKELK